MVRRTLGAAAFGLLLGCSTTSTIYRKNAPPIEAEIIGGSAQSVFVEDSAGRYEIPRSTIADVDYPGNVHALTGSGLIGFGVFTMIAGVDECDRESAAYCVAVFAPAAIGAALVTFGLLAHEQQQSALRDTSLRPRRRSWDELWSEPYPPQRPHRPLPVTRPVVPVRVELPEETGPQPTEPGTPNPPPDPNAAPAPPSPSPASSSPASPSPPPSSSAAPHPPAPPAPPAAPSPNPPAPPAAPSPAPAPSQRQPARVPTKSFPID